MSRPVVATYEDLLGLIGQELSPSNWLEVTQSMVNAFAEATLDRQLIHLDTERAAHGPYGTTVAHGFLVLSLAPHLLREVLDLSKLRAGINYGLDRVRFPAPTAVGSRLRLAIVIREATQVTGGARAVIDYTFEREAGERPACVATGISQFVFA